MRLLTMVCLLIGALTAQASPDIFAGTWKGRGTYIDKGVMSNCAHVELSFAASAEEFSFEAGSRECDFHNETFYRVPMNYKDGKLYFYGEVVGKYDGNVLEAGYRAPDGNSFRNWRMSMRREGDHLMYEESRTMDGDSTPVISFAGMLVLQRAPAALQKLFATPKALPARPVEADHPGSAVYPYEMARENLTLNGRSVTVFTPVGASGPVPVIVYGHGQATPIESYLETFKHLARKGVAVIFPMYDSGFFDQEWRRMAGDFNSLTAAALDRMPTKLDRSRVFYMGHSKGAYIALMAAGAPGATVRPRSLVLFAPAGVDNEYLRAMDPSVPLTLVWGDADTVIARSLQNDILNGSPAARKQLIEVKSYPELSADHYITMSKSTFFGGRDGVSPYHFHGAWKWMLGAVLDVQKGAGVNEPYLYGNEAATSGVPSLNHNITRNW